MRSTYAQAFYQWTESITPGFKNLRGPYSEDLIKFIKPIPGVQWEKSWKIPIECRPIVTEWLKQRGLVCNNMHPVGALPKLDVPELHEYQKLAASRALAENGHIFAFETGLGKSAAAISAVRAKLGDSDAGRILIMCPAVVRNVWKAEIEKWWPAAAKRVHVATNSKNILPDISGNVILVVSYELLAKVPQDGWDVLIADEAHYLKSRKSGRTRAANAIAAANRRCFKLALTGTPIANEPDDIWSIVDWIWPGRFGPYWKFVKRYGVLGGHTGYDVVGLNVDRLEEFRTRMAGIASRVTKADVADLLPPFIVQRVEYTSGKAAIEAGDYALNLLSTNSHVMVLTYGREMAAKVEAHVRRSTRAEIVYIDGEELPERRIALLNEAQQAPSALAICTMKSIGTGVDLTDWTNVVFGELYWSPQVMAQVLGRFHRLSSKGAAHIHLMVNQEDPGQAALASTLLRRINQAGELLKKTVGDDSLTSALTGHVDRLDRLLAVLSMPEDDGLFGLAVGGDE